MIGIDKNRKTFRSDVKTRSGKRLPGLEMYDQGLDVSEINISHGPLPITGRGGYHYKHDYDEVQAVYKTVVDDEHFGLEKIVDIFFEINDSASYINAQTDFTQLIGHTFRVYNPQYLKDNSQPEFFEFVFTNTAGIDPRLVYQRDGLFVNYPGLAGGNFSNVNLKDHLLRPYPRLEKHSEFEIQFESTLIEYGKYNNDPNNPQYEIPLGLPNTAFPTGELDSSQGSEIDPAAFDFSIADVYRSLAVNPYWLYAVITRALYNVLPREYFSILDPDTTTHPNIRSETGSLCLWDKYDLSNTANSTPLRVKIRYNPSVPTGSLSVNNSVSATPDITIDTWDFAKNHKWAKIGYKKLQKDKNMFYESHRTDYLQTSAPTIGTYLVSTNNHATAQRDIRFYGPTISQGTTTPAINAGTPISKYEDQLSNITPNAGLSVQSEVISIQKRQSRDVIYNSYQQDAHYYEDVHYFDPNQQTWTQLFDKWDQWVNINDHSSEIEAKLEHFENMFDYRYAPVRLLPEYPLSGRIDLYDLVRSYYDNMPETVLWNTRKSTTAQSHDLDAVTIIKDTYLKKSEQIDVKKFEDVNGLRSEGESEHALLTITHPGKLYLFGTLGQAQHIPVGVYKAYSWRYESVFNLDYVIYQIESSGTIYDAPFEQIQSPYHPSNGTTSLGSHGFCRLSFTNFVNHSIDNPESIMFEDYFDQLEPDVLDYVEEERWTRIDDEMLIWLTRTYYDHDNNPSTPEIATNRIIEIDRREWQQSDYLYANRGHTSVHSRRVNGIISQEHKR